ncbi:MAG: alpha/beta hydrolase [Bacteroidota bacterium]|nr:alpha/beta hydrolase [Bacteroidota bacterium]
MKSTIYIAFFCVGYTYTDTKTAGKNILVNNPTQNNPQLIKNIVYGLNTSQQLDIYFPDSSKKNNKTIVYIHGGAWCAGDKTEATHWAKYFQNIGYTFVCINYRLTHTRETYIHPAQINDIDAAINFIVSKSIEWKIEKDKLIIMGASAGGHLALLYAYKYNFGKKIKLCISLCSIIYLTDQSLLKADLGDMNGGTMVSWYIGDTITNKVVQWKSASPLYNISQTSVPTFFVHGKKDEIIPYGQSVKAYKLLQNFKIASRLILLDSANHDLLSINLTGEFNEIHKFVKNNLNDG